MRTKNNLVNTKEKRKNEKNKDIHLNYSTLNSLNNANTIVNYSCFCSKCFFSNEKILYILPCCHIVHENCFNNYILKCQYKNFVVKINNSNISLSCPQCNNGIKTVLTEYKINSKKK